MPPASTPYRTLLTVAAVEGMQVAVRAEDVFGSPLREAEISLARKTPLGMVNESRLSTDEDGVASFVVPDNGDYVFTGSKSGLGAGIIAPSVVNIDGRYFVVNRWAPGYQILLGLLMRVGLETLVTISLMGMAVASVYLLARRCFGWQTAFLAATLLLTCALALIMVFEAGMADYASMAFALLGLTLFVEGLVGGRSRTLGVLMLLASGVAFGAAVWMRYSTATLALVPCAYLIVRTVSEWRKDPMKTIVPHLKTFVRRGTPFLVGLLILGFPLASYNLTYFGSPFASGYNFGTLQVTGEGENATGELTSGSFYQNFNPSSAIDTVHLRLGWLVVLVPFILLVPVEVFRRWRSLSTHLLLWTFLSNFLLYIFVPWVASWTRDPTRSIEDMRYFLPGVPSIAVLAASVLWQEMRTGGWRKGLAIGLVLTFVVLGFSMATFGINLQLARFQRPTGGPLPRG